MTKTTKELYEFIEAVCGTGYIKFLDEHEVVPHSISLGFSEKEQKWYGWSHRAIYGFGIGSKTTKGDCSYVADTPQGLIDQHAEFFADISQECADRHRAECAVLTDGSGIVINHSGITIQAVAEEHLDDLLTGNDVPTTEELIGQGIEVRKCGRGEWTATTLEEAKHMAEDFAKSVA